jgi:hypothetical protein
MGRKSLAFLSLKSVLFSKRKAQPKSSPQKTFRLCLQLAGLGFSTLSCPTRRTLFYFQAMFILYSYALFGKELISEKLLFTGEDYLLEIILYDFF